MATEFDTTPPEKPWFHLGVIAPPGYAPPARPLAVRLRGLLARRRERIALRSVFGEPVAVLVGRIAKEMGWLDAMHGPPVGGHKREWVALVSGVNAVAVVHPGGPLHPDLWRVCQVAKWLGVAVR